MSTHLYKVKEIFTNASSKMLFALMIRTMCNWCLSLLYELHMFVLLSFVLFVFFLFSLYAYPSPLTNGQ